MTTSRDIANALDELLAAYHQLATARRGRLRLTANEEAALLLVSQGVAAPTDLSRAIGITTAGMTNLLDRLEGDGLVRRERHDVDKRRVLVVLTKQGFRSQLEVEAMHQEVAELAVDAEQGPTIHRFLVDAAAMVRREAGGSTGPAIE